MEMIEKNGYVSNPQQLYSVRRVTVAEGRTKGMDIIEVCTGGGLQIDILPDTGLDIGQVRYRGVNVAYISRNGYDSPMRINPYEQEFVHTFPGGMLYTCGLRTTGGPHWDGQEWQTEHGRYHSLPAEPVAIYEENGYLYIKGVVREASLFGYNLQLKRTIQIPVMGADIIVNDEITNLGFQDEEYTLLYHCNFGYPLVSAAAKLMLPEDRKTSPRTPHAATGLGWETTLTEPIPGEEERVFFHEEMEHTASLVNPSEHIGVRMTWSESLPILAHWRNMANGDYVCALEPSNNYIMGRKFERENGTLPILKSFESIKTQLNFHFETV